MRLIVDKKALAELADLLPMAATMAGMHVGQNVITGQILKSNAGHKALASMARAGFQHGMAGQKMSPTLHRGLTYAIGPEITADYQVANRVGYTAKRLMSHPPEEQAQILDRFATRYSKRMGTATTGILEKAKALVTGKKLDTEHAPEALEGLRHTPGIRQIYDAAKGNTSPFVDKLLSKAKTVPINQKASKLTNITHGAAAVAGTALSPEIGAQLALNSARQLIGKSKMGRTFAEKQIARGLVKDPNPISTTAKKLILSPRAAELQEMGAGVRHASEKALV